jgi:hypothetical protein
MIPRARVEVRRIKIIQVTNAAPERGMRRIGPLRKRASLRSPTHPAFTTFLRSRPLVEGHDSDTAEQCDVAEDRESGDGQKDRPGHFFA